MAQALWWKNLAQCLRLRKVYRIFSFFISNWLECLKCLMSVKSEVEQSFEESRSVCPVTVSDGPSFVDQGILITGLSGP